MANANGLANKSARTFRVSKGMGELGGGGDGLCTLEIVGQIEEIERIAVGPTLRVGRRLRREYGAGRWRKMKGVAVVCLPDGSRIRAEVHWYEAHGFGRREMKIKRLVGEEGRAG